MSANSHQASGMHLIADLHGIDAARLADPGLIGGLLPAAARAAGATVLFCHCHHFGEHQGVTGVALLAESHISIHTWPQSGYAAIDIFMCGRAQPRRALDLLRETLRPARVEVRRIARGLPGEPDDAA